MLLLFVGIVIVVYGALHVHVCSMLGSRQDDAFTRQQPETTHAKAKTAESKMPEAECES